jgi:hypothetical protein
LRYRWLTKKKIRLVHVSERGLDPDPIVVHVNDVVVWEFYEHQTSDVVTVKSAHDLIKYSTMAQDVLPRRYLSRAFKEPGAYHFVSPSFDAAVNPQAHTQARGLDVCHLFFLYYKDEHELFSKC